MLDKLLTLFQQPDAPVDLTEEEGREAVAAVLVEAARADGTYDADEAARIDEILVKRYALDASAAAELRSAGETAQAAATDVVRFTQAIKRAVPHEERIGVIEAVWELAYADGSRDHEESALVRRLCGLLYVSDRDSGLARQRVEARLGIGGT
ncbi:MAG: TerB family tellurite resistance protein [Paracoccaceae bacterium]